MKKLLVFGIIVLFFSLAFIPSFNAVSIDNNITSTFTETSTEGYNIEILEIIPYYQKLNPNMPFASLFFTVLVKNTGDAPYNEDIKFEAQSIWWGSYIDKESGHIEGGLQPNETWCVKECHWLKFYGVYPPYQYFTLSFKCTPGEKVSASYKIWGGLFTPPKYQRINYNIDIFLRTIDYPFIEHLPFFNLLLQRLTML